MDHPLRILSIEDDVAIVALLNSGLRALDPKISLQNCKTVEEGLRALRSTSEPYHAVLLDLYLPNGRGLDVFRRVQELTPDTPVLVLTGLEDPVLERQCLEEGAEEYLLKGDIVLADLARRIRHALIRHRVNRKFKPAQESLRKAQDTVDKMLAIGPPSPPPK